MDYYYCVVQVKKNPHSVFSFFIVKASTNLTNLQLTGVTLPFYPVLLTCKFDSCVNAFSHPG